jgi:hypothetical protein
MHLKSQLDTRCPTANRNIIEGNKTAKELRPAANGFPPKAMNIPDEKTLQNYPNTLINKTVQIEIRLLENGRNP